MYEIFAKGGPIMWPLLATSIIALSIVMERGLFLWRQRHCAQPQLVEAILRAAGSGDFDEAVRLGEHATDPAAATLVHGLAGKDKSLPHALLVGAMEEVKPFQRGIAALDTIVTLAPFLGLLGTVTGMIRAFGLLGAQELGAPVAITGGIAEALIATAFGLSIAIASLIPLNVLHATAERIKHRVEVAATKLELLLAPAAPARASDETSIYSN